MGLGGPPGSIGMPITGGALVGRGGFWGGWGRGAPSGLPISWSVNMTSSLSSAASSASVQDKQQCIHINSWL